MNILNQVRKIYRFFDNKYNVNQWENVWYDPDKDTMINEMPRDELYDIYIVNKNGKIKIIRKKNKFELIASRFKLYKKYLVIVQLKQEEKEAPPAE